MSEDALRQPMMGGDFWQAMATLPEALRPDVRYPKQVMINLYGGHQNGEVRRRLGAALFADPGLVAACVCGRALK